MARAAQSGAVKYCAALFSLALAGCGEPSDQSLQDAASSVADAPPAHSGDATGNADAASATTNFVEPGPHAVTVTAGSATVNGCDLGYSLFAPESADHPSLLLLGHGFQRSAAQMAGLAEHVASFGVRVVTPNFCHSSFLDTDHQQNGFDAAALATQLADGDGIVFAGHSAGGLAAVVAASASQDSVAVLGLDTVDANDLASGTSASLTIPIFGIVGEPDSCNSNGNGIAMLGGAMHYGVRMVGANHCDFEDPTTGTCTGFCGAQTSSPVTVRALAAAFVLWQLGLDASGEQWAAPTGSEWQRLANEGVLEVL